MKTRITFLLALFCLAFAYSVTGQNNGGRGTGPRKDQLHEAAKKAGGRLVIRYSPARGRIFSDLGELGRHSDAVIIGRTLLHHPRLTPSGNLITNDYLVRVVEVIKGDMPNGRSIIVKVPGGAYKFDDGTYAAIMPSGYREPADKTIYAFFLKSHPTNGASPQSPPKMAQYPQYRLVSESQGAFALTPEGVEPADLDATHPVVANYRGLTPVEFLRQLHRLVPLQKRPAPRNPAR